MSAGGKGGVFMPKRMRRKPGSAHQMRRFGMRRSRTRRM